MSTKYPLNLGVSSSKFLRKPIENPEEIIKLIVQAITKKEKISFLYFWGISPFKSEVDMYDKQAMAFLNLLCSQIAYTFSTPFEVTLLFGDIHASANNIDEAHTNKYFTSVKKLANSFNFSCKRFSAFFSKSELENMLTPNEEIVAVFEREKSHLIKAALNGGSEKTTEQRALNYLTTRLKEREVVAQNFKNSILITSDRPRNKYILPDLHLIYAYTIKTNESKKPWFMYQDKKNISME